ncbi:MAG TPA: glycosyltransferase family 4 protein, partial [Thermoanaerobaculia bacterium]|nr:glycosyltransferase family 4 protein [Thermoanaerobaculia bacterium]
SPAYREAIEGELATGAYDLFNGDFLRTALHTDVAERASIGVSHEVESFAAAATAPDSFASPEAAAEWLAPFLRSLHLEAVVAPARFREYVTVTAPEAAFLARVLPGRRIFVSPIPIDVDALGVAAGLRQPAPVPVFLFFGNFIHPPNRQAARVLAEEVAPRVHEQLPASRFVIAGSDPPAELLAREGRHGLHVAGFVPDLTELTATSTAVLAPIFQGAGMRVKLLEAMAAGCPVVSTSLGLSGIGGESGRTWLAAESVDEFVDAALRLAADPALGERIGQGGRSFVAERYGVAAQGQRRERIWYAALAGRAAPEERVVLTGGAARASLLNRLWTRMTGGS